MTGSSTPTASDAVAPSVSAPPERPTEALVSVVVASDRAGRSGGAVESVLDQTHDEIEVVVVTDGPADEHAVVEEYAGDHENVRAVSSDDDRGVGHARNLGIRAADGAYVCQLDADDRWHPRKVERQLAALEQLRAREDCDPADYCGVYCAGLVRDADGSVVRRIDTGAAGDLWPDVLVRFDVRPASGQLVRRDCLTAVDGYDESLQRGGDWDLAIRLSRHWRWAYVPEPLVERRTDGRRGDATVGSAAAAVAIRERLREKYVDDLAANPDARRRFEAILARQRGLAALEAGERGVAVRRFARAARMAPDASHVGMLGLAILGPGAYRAARRAKRAVEDA